MALQLHMTDPKLNNLHLGVPTFLSFQSLFETSMSSFPSQLTCLCRGRTEEAILPELPIRRPSLLVQSCFIIEHQCKTSHLKAGNQV